MPPSPYPSSPKGRGDYRRELIFAAQDAGGWVDVTRADIPEGLNSRGVSLSELREAFGQELGFDHGEGGGGAMDVAGGIGFFIFSLIVGSIVLLIMGKQLDHFADSHQNTTSTCVLN